MKRLDARGFTAPELLVVIVLFIILLVISLVFLRPKSQDGTNTDANRRLGLAALAQGVKEYHDQIGEWPENVPTTATAVANQDGGYDLCRHIVPGYLQDMAFDPQIGAAYTDNGDGPMPTMEACNAKNVRYDTGYTIRKNSDNSVTLSAPAAIAGAMEITVR